MRKIIGSMLNNRFTKIFLQNNTKKIFIDFFMYGLGDFLLFLVSYLILIPVLTNSLSKEEFGITSTIIVVNVLLLSVFQFGLPSGIFRFYFLYPDGNQRKSYLGTVFLFSLFISILFILCFLTITEDIWESILPTVPFVSYAKFLFWTAFFQVLNAFRSVLLRAQERPKLFVLLEVGQTTLYVGLVYILVTILNEGVLGQVHALFISQSLFSLISMFIIGANIKLSVHFEYIVETLKYSFPIFIGYIVNFFLTRVNILFVQMFITGGAIGIFALGQQLGNSLQKVTASFEKAWQPFLFAKAENTAQRLLDLILKLSIPLYILVVLILSIFSNTIITFLSSGEYSEAGLIMIISALGAAFISISSLVNGGLYYARKSMYSSLTIVISALVNVLLNWLLIPRLGILGSAISGAISGLLVLILKNWGLARYFKVKFDYLSILFSLFIASLIYMLSVYTLSSLNIYLSVIIKFLLLLLYIFLCAWFYKQFRKDEITELISKLSA